MKNRVVGRGCATPTDNASEIRNIRAHLCDKRSIEGCEAVDKKDIRLKMLYLGSGNLVKPRFFMKPYIILRGPSALVRFEVGDWFPCFPAERHKILGKEVGPSEPVLH